jgi:hypothetical protein
MVEKLISKFFRLDEEGWMRHANPWSGWTRIPCLALLVAAFWSRVWLGWYSTILIVAVFLLTYFNPRIFPKPKSTNNWASKAVLGERVWLNRDKVSVPEHHRLVPNILNLVALFGLMLVIWGVYRLDAFATILGTVIAYMGKLWFLDRMVWLWEDMKDLPEYRNWFH